MALQPRERTADPDALISVAQAAALLGVHPNTIRTWTEAGRLVAYRINARGDRRFRRSDVERLLVEGPGVELDEPGSPQAATSGGRDSQLAVIARLARGAGATASASLVCRVAVEALRSELGYPRVAVYLIEAGELVLSTHAGFAVPPPIRRRGDVLRERIELDGHGPQLVEIVLGHDPESVGLVRIEDEADGWLDAAALPFLRTFGDGLAAAVRNAHVLARARREVRRARALRSVTHELTGQLDPATVLDQIVERTRSLFDADKAGVWLVGAGEFPFELAAQRGLGEPFLEAVRGLRLDSDTVGVRAVREGRPLWARNVSQPGGSSLLEAEYAAEGIRTACVVPLMGPDRALGLIGLYHCSDRLWPDDEVALVQAFANHAAVTIQNARLYRSVADQAARMRSIQDLSSRLNRLTDVTAIGEAIVAEASPLADYHDIRIYRIDWERRVCEPIAFTREMLGDEGDPFELLRVKVGEGLTGWAAEHGEAMLVNDALADPRAMTIEGTDEIEESMLVVPMMYESRAVGVIVLSQLGSNRFTPDDLQTMSIFAGQAAQAIANADAYARLSAQSDQLARQLDSQRRLLEINERLLSTLDNEAVLESIADGLHTVVAYDNLSIFRADRAERRLVPVLARERYVEEVMRHVVPFGRGLMGWVVEHGEPVLANDALADPRVIQIPGTPEEPEAVIVVPLVADDEVIGAMNVGRIGREEVYFSETDFELVKLFAAQASIALRNADAHHAVSLRAETDALTGLGNHGAFQRDLGQLLAAESGPGDHRLAMLMMDLDRFKAYNDRHGHPAGDALLHAIATAIYGAARSSDRVYRYGGDEFALILPNATVAQAARVGDRIRRAVVELTSSNATPVTITVGVAAIPGDAQDRAGLIAAADTALYYGKRSGENRVVRARDVPTETRELRGTLDDLARAALRGGEETDTVEHLVEQAARLSTGDELHRHDSVSVRDALLAVARSFETQGGELHGHADRVGRLGAAIAERLLLTDEETHVIELAARLHVLEEGGVAELEPIPSLGEVARIIRGYRSLVAGSGDADASASAHIVAAANEYDELVSGAGGRGLGRADAMRSLRQHPSRLRPDVLDALANVVAARPDAGHRRRRSDPAKRSRAKASAA